MEEDIKNYDIKKNFYKLTVQNTENPKFDMNPNIIGEYNERLKSRSPKPKSNMNDNFYTTELDYNLLDWNLRMFRKLLK